MAKAKTTRKWVADNYTCVSVGYCSLQYLLYFQSPRFYTCGVYGWNCDIYTFGNYAITTGYRGMISHVDGLGYDKTNAYETKAEKIIHDKELAYEEKAARVNHLLEEYLQEVFKVFVKVF